MHDPGGPSKARHLNVVVPCYNEEDVLPAFYSELKKVLLALPDISHTIYFVDDGSQDGTLPLLNELAENDEAIEVYSLSRNFGHQVALSAGLDAVQPGGAVAMLDCDLQHPPALLTEMTQRWREGYDIVSAVRSTTGNVSIFKKAASASFYRLVNLLSETPIAPGVADFCLLSPRATAALKSMPERHRFLRGMISWIGYPRTFISFEAPPRHAGESKYTLWKMMRLALDATFSFSSAPLRLATRMGATIIFLGAVYFCYIIGRHLLLGDLVEGWASVLSTLLILGGAQLMFLGLVGEYLSRVFEESKNRPLYFLKQCGRLSNDHTTDDRMTDVVMAEEGVPRDESR